MRAVALALSIAFMAGAAAAEDRDVSVGPQYVPDSFNEQFRTEGIRLDTTLPLYVSDEGLVYRGRNFEIDFGPAEIPGQRITRGQPYEDDVYLVRIRFGLAR